MAPFSPLFSLSPLPSPHYRVSVCVSLCVGVCTSYPPQKHTVTF